ncbi:P-loop containing nucleoside triphosphate hydrolase protein [Mollisia scopiformis]|uniref:p-loop containing nucleoside triphosphate hydrolase protein n=1 Tax=Mollisia scopiformis TaxID=149040 RepID=A0A132B9F4_MOLSC|nr:P-loop containing nucleoside triphosphate hydrolase protein [Mollisia scopiformis]KUJ08504.1 P-loop containing nucleoside triphosphate hydrolase protein [Mollisia scopiformis]
MTDLSVVLPNFPTDKYARILQIVERSNITTADLLTLDSVELAKHARPLGIGDAKTLSDAVQEALRADLGLGQSNGSSSLKKSGSQLVESWSTISTLDDDLDAALGGGIPTGYITEVTGERYYQESVPPQDITDSCSGAGKTQFLLTLLLSAQLPAPHGLGAPTIYISTESPLPTSRLSSMINTHPLLSRLAPAERPTLDRVINISTPDLESQDHILRYQLPVAVERHGVKLVILDSVAANYRAEFERGLGGTGSSKNMAQRSGELIKLGELLQVLARDHGVAIVVANQVGDRFSNDRGGSSPIKRLTQSSPLARRNGPPSSIGPPSSGAEIPNVEAPFRGTPDPMSLDHQQRWFTGWGDDPNPSRLASMSLKTPSLGLIWTTQIACRIALIKRPVYGPGLVGDEETERGEPVLRKWKRWMKVVFAPHAKASGPGLEGAVEFQIRADGIAAVKKKGKEVDDGYEDDTLV